MTKEEIDQMEESSTVVIKEGRYFIGIWFLAGDEVDWMATAYRDLADEVGKWSVRHRFRYYSKWSNDPWDGRDRKSAYHMTINGVEEREVKEKIDKLTMMMVETMGYRRSYLNLQTSDHTRVLEELSKQKWA